MFRKFNHSQNCQQQNVDFQTTTCIILWNFTKFLYMLDLPQVKWNLNTWKKKYYIKNDSQVADQLKIQDQRETKNISKL